MIKEFVERWDSKKSEIEAKLTLGHPESYETLVKYVVEILHDGSEYASPDPERITLIDHGDYQGTLLFIIGATGYQPHDYWSVKVWYGSCSGCDTLEAIRKYRSGIPTPEQIKDYMTLCLHIVQNLCVIGEGDNN